jgi:hypothetical protein
MGAATLDRVFVAYGETGEAWPSATTDPAQFSTIVPSVSPSTMRKFRGAPERHRPPPEPSRLVAEPLGKLDEVVGLANPRLPDDEDHLPVACLRKPESGSRGYGSPPDKTSETFSLPLEAHSVGNSPSPNPLARNGSAEERSGYVSTSYAGSYRVDESCHSRDADSNDGRIGPLVSPTTKSRCNSRRLRASVIWLLCGRRPGQYLQIPLSRCLPAQRD